MPPGLLLAVALAAAAPCSCSCCEVRHLGLRCTSGTCASTTSTCSVGAQPEELASQDFNALEGENATAAKAAGAQLAAALEAKEVDLERFCWASCVPKAGLCEAGTPVDQPAEEVAPAAAAPPARLRGALVKTQASASTAAPKHLEDLQQVSVRAEDDAKVAKDELALAAQAAKVTTKVHSDAARFEPAVADDVKQAQEEASRGALDVTAANSMLEQTWKAARSAAADVEKDTIKGMRKAAHDKAEAEARKVGEELQKKMKAAAGPAGLAAMKPYNDAMAGAAAAAAGWAKQGDGASGLSFQLGMQASMIMGSANQWNAVGQYAKAQNMLRDSLDLSRQADGLAGAAQGAYDQAASIMSTLGGYVSQAGAAQYHAQYMLDPEAYPPVAFG